MFFAQNTDISIYLYNPPLAASSNCIKTQQLRILSMLRRLIENRDLILPVIDQPLFLHPRHLPGQRTPLHPKVIRKFLAVHGEEGALSVCGELGQHEL